MLPISPPLQQSPSRHAGPTRLIAPGSSTQQAKSGSAAAASESPGRPGSQSRSRMFEEVVRKQREKFEEMRKRWKESYRDEDTAPLCIRHPPPGHGYRDTDATADADSDASD